MKSNHFAEVGKMSEKKEFEPLDVGATERVDWRTAQGLSKYVHFDENGNLEVDGATKLSGGLEPIHEYTFDDDGAICKLGVFFEAYLSLVNAYNFIGYIVDSDDDINLCFGQYSIVNGQLKNIYALYFYDTQEKPNIQSWSSSENSSHYYYPALENNTQEKIYVHTLTLAADKSYILTYYSTNNSIVNSVASLRQIMHISLASDSAILPVCATDLSATAILQVTTALCKIGTANVTAVSDKVTNL